jgi:hypothetical protein
VTRLQEAVELKLGEQRRFVLWWDGQEKQAGTRTWRNGPVTPALASFGVDRMTLHRWRTRLKDAHRYEQAVGHHAGTPTVERSSRVRISASSRSRPATAPGS